MTDDNGRKEDVANDAAPPIKSDETRAGESAEEPKGQAPGTDEAAEALKAIEAVEAAAKKSHTTMEERLAVADGLQKTDTLKALELMRDAILAGVDDLAAGQLQTKIGKKLERSAPQMKAHWAQCAAEIARAKAKLSAAALDPDDQRPRLEIQEGHPDRTVTDLRDILASSGRLFERGAPVRIVYGPRFGRFCRPPAHCPRLGAGNTLCLPALEV